MFSYAICEFLRPFILNNICEIMLLFVSPQNIITNSGGEFGLDETWTECNASIFLNVTYFSNKMQPYNLYIVKRSFFNILINIVIKFLTLTLFKF